MKFVSIAMQLREVPHGIVIYYTAVDSKGRIWSWDTDQGTERWHPLPPHPDRGDAGQG